MWVSSNESVLEVPFFSNNYGHWPNLRITLEYKLIAFSGNIDQGIVSNDCFPNGNGLFAAGNSLFISVNGNNFNGGLKDTPTTGTTVTVVSNIEWSQSTFPRVATQLHHYLLFINDVQYHEQCQCVESHMPLNDVTAPVVK